MIASFKLAMTFAMETSRRVAKEEGIFSRYFFRCSHSRSNSKAKNLGKGKTVLTVLPSNGERYLSTPLYSFDD